MTELLEFLVKALVEEPEAVVVEELEEDGDLIYEISVAEGDLGRVIGKGGRVAHPTPAIAQAPPGRGARPGLPGNPPRQTPPPAPQGTTPRPPPRPPRFTPFPAA